MIQSDFIFLVHRAVHGRCLCKMSKFINRLLDTAVNGDVISLLDLLPEAKD